VSKYVCMYVIININATDCYVVNKGNLCIVLVDTFSPLQFAPDGKHSVLSHKFKSNDYLPIDVIIFATIYNYPIFTYFYIPDFDAIGW
jgi:hypothetical protein